jgi:serine/threonine protein kinase
MVHTAAQDWQAGRPEYREPWIVPYGELTVGKTIGSGGFSTVSKGLWRGEVLAARPAWLGACSGCAGPAVARDRGFVSVCRPQMVAIKQLLCQEHTPERMEELLRQEASLLNKLRHKNIIEFKAACISPPRFCIVLEFAALGTLSKHIRNTLDPCKAGFGSGCLLPCAWGETASLRVHPFHSW